MRLETSWGTEMQAISSRKQTVDMVSHLLHQLLGGAEPSGDLALEVEYPKGRAVITITIVQSDSPSPDTPEARA